MMKTLRLIAILILSSNLSFAQSIAGEIHGRITDEKKQPLDFAVVQALQGGILKGGAKTDLNGNYSIKPLAPGDYTIKVSYTGMVTQEVQDVPLGNDGRRKVDIQLLPRTVQGKEVVIVGFVKPIVDASDPGTPVMSRIQMKQAPTNNTSDFAAMNGGVYQRRQGDNDVSIGGDRSSGTMYMVDGMMIRSGNNRNVNFPPGAIDRLELISNGMSAKYGNATGGIVGITTRGIQSDFSGSVQLQHSVEGYNNNLAAIDLSGPLYSVKKGNGEKRPVLGFVFNTSLNYDKDPSPYFRKYNRLKPSKLEELQERPLIPNPNGTGNFVRAAEQVTEDDFELVKARENGDALSSNTIFKLDFQPTDNINITLGSYLSYNNTKEWSFSNSLFAPEANRNNINYSGRGYLRLTQRLGKSASQEKEGAKKSAIQNAYYSIQFTYQKDYNGLRNSKHKDNIFDYGYVGNFTTHRSNTYIIDTALGGYLGIKFLDEFSDSVSYYGGGLNPILENYTDAIFADKRFPVPNITALQAYGGLANGDLPPSNYGLWTGIGSQVSVKEKSETDQISLNLDASLDILQGMRNTKRIDPIKHNIQFGLGYDQRTSRRHAVLAPQLWQLMRITTNRHIQEFDLLNPVFIVDGVKYTKDDLDNGVVRWSPFDTIDYNRLYVASDQSRFDKELRKKLYGDGADVSYRELIDIDKYDPKMFSLDMFSPDDLFNQGNDYVSYFGYDYLGNKTKSQPSFNDFWTKKDARGDNERPIGAFRPIYMFGYILDKFSYKDLSFNIGLRVDRYDANQKVLKDPYSLYGVRSNGDLKAGTYELAIDRSDNDKRAPDPSTFSPDYVPYIDNNQAAKPTVVGYRKGDVWFDPFGKEIADPTVLSGLYGGGLPIQPWLINKNDSIKAASFNPNNSFEDYKPQVALSPRIQFAFPISENSLFYGNYDVINQTPSSGNQVTPDDYYFLAERQGIINNANLQMEKAINYTLGYQQKISKNIGLTLEAYYRERKNQIQLQNYLLAYPITYRSFGNRDFSSTKGLKVKLEFRRLEPLRMQVDYTLQFAEGTGSSTTSQNSLLATGQPNLRSVFPLDFDSRHMLNYTIDYRFSEKSKGPEVNGKYPLKNAGINLLLRARSGEPYSRSNFATSLVGGDFQSTPLLGTINGSRLPWQYEISTRIDKDFLITKLGRKVNKETKEVIKEGRPIGINVYTFITNLLNTRNTLSAYRYTGVGDDDGYLSSPQGQQALTNQQFQQSYMDLYSYRLIDPTRYNIPRRINLGLSLNF